MMISPVSKVLVLELINVEVFETTIGMIGTCACWAKWNAPFLKESKVGVVEYDLVPSGKMYRPLFLSFKSSSAAFKVLTDFSLFERSKKKVPLRDMNQPKNGIHFKDFLEVTVHPGGKIRPNIKISRAD